MSELPLKLHKVEPEERYPLIGDINHGAFANPMFKVVLEKFGNIAFARSSACMEFENFVRRINARGETCLEIGTYQGMSAIILTQFFNKVICVSVDDDLRRVIKHEIVELLGIQHKIKFYDVNNNQEKYDLIRFMNFDFCYIDGDHTNDTLTDFSAVKKCGRVLFHEYWPLQPPVWNLVNSLPQNEVTRAHFDCFAYWEKHNGSNHQ